MDELIYGRSDGAFIVSVEVENDKTVIFCEHPEGDIQRIEQPSTNYILFSEQISPKMQRLKGDQHYKYILEYPERTKYEDVLKQCYKKRYDIFTVRDPKEAFLVRTGNTYFKGLKVDQVSALSFDIETDGLVHRDSSKVYLISNTYRQGGHITRKLFSLDEYKTQGEMLTAWCDWVREVNPSVVLGHNIFSFDFPYLSHVADLHNISLNLGRDGSEIRFHHRTSQFRKDGSQAYDYTNAFIYGREIVDTYFLAIKYDIGRKYESYGLKQIIKQEGLERKGRVLVDAGQINKLWENETDRKKVKAYAEGDADDSLALYDLMIPSLFYYTQSIPRSFQQIINSATGSQINSLMVRAYLQQGHSIAKGSDSVEYEGAISLGNPGVHRNVWRLDVQSLYPSIIRQYKVYSKDKDPQAVFLKVVNFLTEERLKNKKLGKETNDRYYKDLEQSQKIMINSFYGALGAPKLNYNYPKGAAVVTRYGRDILQKGIDWLESHGFKLAACDTDGIALKKADEKLWSEAERTSLLAELNSQMDDLIRWEDDGVLRRQIVIKTKNYIMQDPLGLVTIKGSGLKASMKERGLQKFIKEVIDLLLKDRKDQILFLYLKYIKEVMNLKDITDWCCKKTITKAILNPERTNEQRVADALKGTTFSEGDKIYVFNKTETELCLMENFSGTYSVDTLLGKLYDTLKVFGTVIDIEVFPDFTLKRNKTLLGELGYSQPPKVIPRVSMQALPVYQTRT